ncbi:uncharacterized protein LOC130369557 [Hyla sarda]|uniref:uncharacterized protein LOC130369557 n=1 Tax=Hyla sarda TaxID=327740 RepID=UPI0024C223B5|nr:uncharacterized protein LOC130369557 [Hyla sarda]
MDGKSLFTNPTVGEIIKSGVRFAPRRAPTLSNLLVPSMVDTASVTTQWISTKGFHKCGKSRCVVCPFAEKCQKIEGTVDGKCHVIHNFINCDSTFVLYKIMCTQCHLTYVGSTKRSLKKRMQEHIRHAAGPLSSNISNISKHFLICHNSDTTSLRFSGIEKVTLNKRGGDHIRSLHNREIMWIYLLNCIQPHGLNSKTDLILHY